jgi:predicted enzyme related to lactoylglutathione lyase
MPNPVVHFEAIGPDGPALIKFYADAFQWSINSDNPMGYGIVDTGGEGINGGVAQAPPDGSGKHLTFYIQVDNPPMDVPGGPKLAHFEDPAGNFVGLVEAGSMQGAG